MSPQARLILKDGKEFIGESFGADRSMAGELVFNTGMTGYVEALTDPSYKGQILVLTYPLVGNYGVPETKKKNGIPLSQESDRIQVSGVVVSEYCDQYHHWNAKQSLAQWLQQHDIPAITGVDTRMLTQHIREKGTPLAKLLVHNDVDWYDPAKDDVVKQVSIEKPILYSSQQSPKTLSEQISRSVKRRKRVVLVDCGVKNNILHCFLKRNVDVIRVPYDYNFLKLDYDGLFISNGPGDPTQCKKTITNLKKALKGNKPIWGICLGNQLLALAAGAQTYKLPYGHRSQNQPCIRVGTKRCYITSQNHGYAVKASTLPTQWKQSFVNANDNSNEGIMHKAKPFFSVQFHPEAKAGPMDTEFLFDEFVRNL